MQRSTVRANSRTSESSSRYCSRRSLLVVPFVLPFVSKNSVMAAMVPPNDAENPYIQELLRRTEEKKEERRVERLNDYYRRNYREFFDFLEGSSMEERQGLSPETAAAVRKWISENEEKPLPGIARLRNG